MSGILEFNLRKAVQAANFFAASEPRKAIGKLKLIKLLYFVDRYHLRKYGRPVFNDSYWAMRLGPVGSSVKDVAELSLEPEELEYAVAYINKDDSDPKHPLVKSINDPDRAVFSKSEIESLEAIQDSLGGLQVGGLIDASHQQPEWAKHEIVSSGEASRTRMFYDDFFLRASDTPTQDDVDLPVFSVSPEVLENSREVYREQVRVAKIWE
jgi:uncharacterized phage-associated protein